MDEFLEGKAWELQYSRRIRMMLTFSITGLEVFMMFQNCFMNSLYHFGNSRNSWQTGFVARAGMLVHSCWRPWRRILSGVEPRFRGRSHCEGFPGDSPQCIGPKWILGRARWSEAAWSASGHRGQEWGLGVHAATAEISAEWPWMHASAVYDLTPTICHVERLLQVPNVWTCPNIEFASSLWHI